MFSSPDKKQKAELSKYIFPFINTSRFARKHDVLNQIYLKSVTRISVSCWNSIFFAFSPEARWIAIFRKEKWKREGRKERRDFFVISLFFDPSNAIRKRKHDYYCVERSGAQKTR